MVRHINEIKIGDVLTQKESKEKFEFKEFIPADEREGKNFYFPLLGYVRDKAMNKMFETEKYNYFIIG